MLYTVKREFKRRDDNEAVGNVTFQVDVSQCAINGSELPGVSIEHLLTFALQSLQDAYAGASDYESAKAAFDSKLDKIVNGTIGTRTSAPIDVIVARDILEAKAKANPAKPLGVGYAACKTAKEKREFLDAVYEKNMEALSKDVQSEIKRRKAAAALDIELDIE